LRTGSEQENEDDYDNFNLLVTSTRNKSMSFNTSRGTLKDGIFPFTNFRDV